MDAVCRACLNSYNEIAFNIFEHFHNERSISEMLVEYTSVQIQKNDGLPTNICSVCFDSLSSACDFKTMVIDTDKRLRSSDCLMTKNNPALFCKEESSIENDFPNGLMPDSQKPNSHQDIIEEKNLILCTRDQETSEGEIPLLNDPSGGEVSQGNGGNFTNIEITSKQVMETENIDDGNSLSRGSDYETDDCENDDDVSMRVKNIHLSIKEKNQKAVFCKECKRSFGYRYYFEVHARNHIGDQPYKCDICGKGFVRQFILNNHKMKHSTDRPYACEVCGKTFKFKTNVKNHTLHVHSDTKEFKCEQCGKMLKTQNGLRTHLLRHENDKKFVCEECGKAFVCSTGLTHHRVVHKIEKDFACSTCGKTFSSKGRMKQHQKLHVDAKPYECNHCGKRFNHKTVLRAHVRIHTGEKPYTCKICAKSFRQLSVINLHMRTHTGETPYECKLCPCKFKYVHHLQNHVKKTHK